MVRKPWLPAPRTQATSRKKNNHAHRDKNFQAQQAPFLLSFQRTNSTIQAGRQAGRARRGRCCCQPSQQALASPFLDGSALCRRNSGSLPGPARARARPSTPFGARSCPPWSEERSRQPCHRSTTPRSNTVTASTLRRGCSLLSRGEVTHGGVIRCLSFIHQRGEGLDQA